MILQNLDIYEGNKYETESHLQIVWYYSKQNTLSDIMRVEVFLLHWLDLTLLIDERVHQIKSYGVWIRSLLFWL